MKNILFLLDYYKENNSANGVCCRNVAECLAKKGYKVFVGCYRPLEAPEEEIQNDIHVIKTWIMPNMPTHKTLKDKITVYFRWLNPFTRRPAAAVKSREDAIYLAACRVIEKEEIDTVVCVHLPSETLLAGCRIKKRYPTLYVCAYQLDTLSGGNLPRFLPSNYSRRHQIAWERCLFKSMDRIILMRASKKHHMCYTPNEAWLSKAVYGDIPLFVPASSPSFCKHRNGYVRIAFAGTISESLRTPYHIIKVLSRLKTKHVVLVLAGINQCRHALPKVSGSLELVEIGQIDHERVLRLLNESDVLLSIGARNPSLPSGKIFEYMAMGKPIIGTFWDDEDVTMSYLDKYPLALKLDERDSDLDQQAVDVEKFFDDCVCNKVDVSQLRELFQENSPDFFEKLLTVPDALKEIE